MKYLENKKIAIAVALFCAVLWGLAYPLLKLTYQAFDVTGPDVATKLMLAGLRFFGAGVFVWLIKKQWGDKTVRPDRHDWWIATWLGVLGVTLQNIFFYIGLGNSQASTSAIIQSSAIFMTLIISTLILRMEKLRWVQVVSLVFGFGGVILTSLGKGGGLGFRWNGEAMLLGSALTVAITSIMVKQQGSRANPLFYAAWQMIIGASPLLLVGLILQPDLKFTLYSTTLLVLSAIKSGLVIVLWYSLIQAQSVVEMSFYRLFNPVFGILLSALLLGEALSTRILLSLGLIVSGALILQLKKRQDVLARPPLPTSQDVM